MWDSTGAPGLCPTAQRRTVVSSLDHEAENLDIHDTALDPEMDNSAEDENEDEDDFSKSNIGSGSLRMIDLKTLLRCAGGGAAAVAVFLALLTAAFRLQAGRAFEQARAAEDRGDLKAAIENYDTAIRRFYPFSSIAERSAERLEAIAAQYEKRGSKDDARITYQTLLSALSAVDTGFSGARKRRIEELEKKVDEK